MQKHTNLPAISRLHSEVLLLVFQEAVSGHSEDPKSGSGPLWKLAAVCKYLECYINFARFEKYHHASIQVFVRQLVKSIPRCTVLHLDDQLPTTWDTLPHKPPPFPLLRTLEINTEHSLLPRGMFHEAPALRGVSTYGSYMPVVIPTSWTNLTNLVICFSFSTPYHIIELLCVTVNLEEFTLDTIPTP